MSGYRIALRPAADRAAALRRLAPVERHATDGATVVDMAAGAELIDVIECGQVVGAFAVEVAGDRATIRAAAGTPQCAGLALALLERSLSARGVRTVGAFTRRPGLVRRMLGAGYELAEAELVKGIA